MPHIESATANDLSTIQKLAHEIWPPTYDPILPAGQVSYMLGLFYSAEALQQQVAEGHQFLLLYHEGQPSGFASYSLVSPGIAKLHKLYVLPQLQGHGLGALLTHAVKERAKALGAEKLILYVNKDNKPAQTFYGRKGFRFLKEDVADIGNGYVMDDMVLETDL